MPESEVRLMGSYMKVARDRAVEALDAVEAGAPLWQATEALRSAIRQLDEGLDRLPRSLSPEGSNP